MGQWRAVVVARVLVEVEAEMRAGGDLRPAARKIAEAELGSLQIGEDADRPAGLALDLANLGKARAMLVVGAMAEIEAEDVDAGLEQGADALEAGARRPHGRDDLGAAPPPQRPIPTTSAVSQRITGRVRGWRGSH